MKKIISNQYVYSIFTKGITTFTGIISAILVNRFLGPSLKGEYAYVLNIVTMITIFLNLGIYHSYPYFCRIGLQDIKIKYINVIYIQFFVYSTIAGIIFFIISNFSLIIVFAMLPIMTLNNQLLFISLVDSPNERNKMYIFSELFYTALTIIVFLLFEKSYSIALVILVLKEVGCIVLITYKFKYKPNFKKYSRKQQFADMWIFIKNGYISMLSLFLITLNYRADILIMQVFLDPWYIGLYSVGVMLSEKAIIFGDAFRDVLFSKTSKDDSVNDIMLIIKINLLICTISFLAIIVFGKDVLTILFGNDFRDAYTVTILIFAGNFGIILFKMTYTLFIATKKRIVSFIFLLICTLTNVILNFILVPNIGMNGAAIASAVSYNVCGFLFFIYFSKEYNKNVKEIFYFTKDEVLLIKSKIKNKMNKTGEKR